jgi:hypothetical protein
MLVITSLWIVYGVAAVIQLFTSGAKVLDSLPPFWFWGIPLAPYTALYTPWAKVGAVPPGMQTPPETPMPPTPETPA